MAKFIPALSACAPSMNNGEKRFSERLAKAVGDDGIIWLDAPGRGAFAGAFKPPFMILIPQYGLLVLDVKTLLPEQLVADSGELRIRINPLVHVRALTKSLQVELQGMQALVNREGEKPLCFACEYGVVLPHIIRDELQAFKEQLPADFLPEHRIICRDDLFASVEPATFLGRLTGMFAGSSSDTSPRPLSATLIAQIRGCLFPDIIINREQWQQVNHYLEHVTNYGNDVDDSLIGAIEPVTVMDIDQEHIARGMGQGHRVLHGVAGSGKTLVLLFRVRQLVRSAQRPLLVVFYNDAFGATLTAAIDALLPDAQQRQRVEVVQFHTWCTDQLSAHDVAPLAGNVPYLEKQVLSVQQAVADGRIPTGQYDAVMIDEGHNFERDWLKLLVSMVNPKTDALLFLYDDAQLLYRHSDAFAFSLASVGIKARGRSSIMSRNYRNTHQILDFAYRFARSCFGESADENEMLSVVQPDGANRQGVMPVYEEFVDADAENVFVIQTLASWQREGVPLSSIAVICGLTHRASDLVDRLNSVAQLPFNWLNSQKAKACYDATDERVALVTREGSCGLEFERVILCGFSEIPRQGDGAHDQDRLSYIAMTRARSQLVVTCLQDTFYSRCLRQVASL